MKSNMAVFKEQSRNRFFYSLHNTIDALGSLSLSFLPNVPGTVQLLLHMDMCFSHPSPYAEKD